MKYVICFPTNGFNDMISAINRCFEYALKYNRLLIIDTTQTGWFSHDIHEYILFEHPNIYVESPATIYPIIKNLKTYPNNGNICKMNRSFQTEHNILNDDHAEDILIYNCPGLKSVHGIIWQHLRFKSLVTDVFFSRLKSMPTDYNSFHVRNTDYKTLDLDDFMETHKNAIMLTSFIASDDYGVICKFKEMNKCVYTFSNIPKLGEKEKNIHFNHSNVDQRKFIIDCFVDLLLLASANSYIYSCKASGYSRLAEYLFNNKDLLKKITTPAAAPYKNGVKKRPK